MSDQLLINGNQYSWSSLVVKAGGQLYTGFTAISFGEKRERSFAWGMGRQYAPRGRTGGKYTPDNAKLTGPVSSVQALRQDLAALSVPPGSYGDAEFQILVQYLELASSEAPITVILNRCTWVTSSASHAEGTDALVEDVELMPMTITRNGLTLFTPSVGL